MYKLLELLLSVVPANVVHKSCKSGLLYKP